MTYIIFIIYQNCMNKSDQTFEYNILTYFINDMATITAAAAAALTSSIGFLNDLPPGPGFTIAIIQY